MSDKISVDKEQVEHDAEAIAKASQYFTQVDLMPLDMRSTITANENSKTAYQRAQDGIAAMAVALDQDVENIRSLNVAFEQFDQMMGELSASGSRTPAATTAK